MWRRKSSIAGRECRGLPEIPLDRRVHVRPAARLWFRWRTERVWSATIGDTGCTFSSMSASKVDSCCLLPRSSPSWQFGGGSHATSMRCQLHGPGAFPYAIGSVASFGSFKELSLQAAARWQFSAFRLAPMRAQPSKIEPNPENMEKSMPGGQIISLLRVLRFLRVLRARFALPIVFCREMLPLISTSTARSPTPSATAIASLLIGHSPMPVSTGTGTCRAMANCCASPVAANASCISSRRMPRTSRRMSAMRSRARCTHARPGIICAWSMTARCDCVPASRACCPRLTRPD